VLTFHRQYYIGIETVVNDLKGLAAFVQASEEYEKLRYKVTGSYIIVLVGITPYSKSKNHLILGEIGLEGHKR